MPSTCCHKSALDLSADWCQDCGKPLLFCPAHDECGGLLGPDGVCPICIAPELVIGEGAREVGVGGLLSVPLRLRNTTRTGRPLMLLGAWMRERDGEWRSVDVTWERLDAGAEGPITLHASALAAEGTQRIEVLLALGSRWRWREERAAFASSFEVVARSERTVNVEQHINYGSEASTTPGSGGTIYAPLKVQGSSQERPAAQAAEVLPLTRAERWEASFGLRGYDDGTVVSRAAQLVWRGFANGETPEDRPLTGSRARLTLGRSRARAAGGSGDVRLLSRQSGGSVDETRSRSISREHFSLCLEAGCVVLRVESDHGALVNGRRAGRGTSVLLRDGDRFSPLTTDTGTGSSSGTHPSADIGVRFETQHGVVETVVFQRS